MEQSSAPESHPFVPVLSMRSPTSQSSDETVLRARDFPPLSDEPVLGARESSLPARDFLSDLRRASPPIKQSSAPESHPFMPVSVSDKHPPTTSPPTKSIL
ncbi:hypothetical protein BJ508DRAFT_82752 [Ascobolus immersus RN42]|uniref:Uncharacterized protein n=1 Tax=Ascobolus immersus RN42 TaxID=1160509 RepID=A0A3N4HBV2_ASCIM|nr:hypothetical protein BJ508DRAFT_82752 [Ascobolus immersus RN42]